jgi:hypothetical protein
MDDTFDFVLVSYPTLDGRIVSLAPKTSDGMMSIFTFSQHSTELSTNNDS